MRALSLAIVLSVLPLTVAFAQSGSTSAPILTISPSVGDQTAVHQLQGHGLAPNVSTTVVLIAPDGTQSTVTAQTDASGSLFLALQPPDTLWQYGLYRVAVGLPGNRAVSATFVVTDGQAHLYAEPNLPSPFSSFNFVGTGLPSNASISVQLVLANALGEGVFPVTTSSDGTFSIYVWPQQFGFSAFSPGYYQVSVPSLQLSTTFIAREHPNSSSITIDGLVQPNAPHEVDFDHYNLNRYVWGVYADQQDRVLGEFLVGPTDAVGSIHAPVHFGDLAPGQYFLATPYDWGETTFTVPDPPPTATAIAVPTARPTATPASRPTYGHDRCARRYFHHRAHCAQP